MARAPPSASSVLAPTRSRPSLIVNGICAEATDNAPAESTGSTIRRSMTSSVAWPLSLARIATSKARGSSPATWAASSVTMPLPDNAPVSADALRPSLANVICIEVRPAGMLSPR